MLFERDDIPFLRILLPFALGILTGIYGGKDLPSLLPVLLFAVLAIGIVQLLLKRMPNRAAERSLLVGMFALLFLGGYELSLQRMELRHDSHFSHHLNAESYALIQIEEPPIEKNKSIKTEVKVLQVFKDSLHFPTSGKAIIYLQKSDESRQLQYGDQLYVFARFNEVEPPKNPHQFDYGKYLRRQNIYHQAYFPQSDWHFTGKNEASPFFEFIYGIRAYLLRAIARYVPSPDAAAVSSALLLGYKDLLETEIVQIYSHTGAMHILAVSGLHVGILYLLLGKITGFLDKRGFKARVAKVALLLAGIWMYAFITGLPPSVFRAATMFSFFAVGKLYQRPTNVYNILAVSAIVLLCINPFLLMQAGFQLSYVAVAGIVLWQPPIYGLFTFKNWLGNKAWEIVSVSIAAQLATFPISLYYFHQFPVYFMLSNLIVIPAAGAILYVGMAFFALAGLFLLSGMETPVIAVGWFLNKIVDCLNWLLRGLQSLPGAYVQGISISPILTYLLYAVLLCFTLFFLLNRVGYFKAALTGILLFCIGTGYKQLQNAAQRQITVYHVPNHTAVEFSQGKRALVLADSALVAHPEPLQFNAHPNQEWNGISQIGLRQLNAPNDAIQAKDSSLKPAGFFQADPFIRYQNCNMVLLHHPYPLVIPPETADGGKYESDILLLTQNTKHRIEPLTQWLNIGVVVMDASNGKGKIRRWISECEQLGIAYVNVADTGAFVHDLNARKEH